MKAAAPFCVVLVLLAGCQMQATSEGMRVATPPALAHTHPHAVSVSATGAEETAVGGLAGAISNADLEEAISASIRSSGLFADVVEADAAAYRLAADLISVRRPLMGGAMRVDVEIGWGLTDLGADEVVWRQAIATDATTSFGTAFAAATRVTLSTEAAIRANIEEAMRRIGMLELPPASPGVAALWPR